MNLSASGFFKVLHPGASQAEYPGTERNTIFSSTKKRDSIIYQMPFLAELTLSSHKTQGTVKFKNLGIIFKVFLKAWDRQVIPFEVKYKKLFIKDFTSVKVT